MRGTFDAVVDCQNGIPFFSPLFVRNGLPIVQVVHHVHQEQFRNRFSRPMAAFGRFLEGSLARWVYGQRTIAAVSPSTRTELRRLGYGGPIFVVPNGTIDIPDTLGPRHPDPTITVVSRLVPHKRIDLLLGQVAVATRSIPRLRLDIVGDGPEKSRLQHIAADLGMDSTVTFHGYQPDTRRDYLLSRAWLTASTSTSEGWGCSIIEAAAWGVPCLALRVPGIRDSVLGNRTGWLVDCAKDFGDVLVAAVNLLSKEVLAKQIAVSCQEWARCFRWDRSAALLAGVMEQEFSNGRHVRGKPERRGSLSDDSILAHFQLPNDVELRSSLRPTDEFVEDGRTVSALLNGYDRSDALALMHGIGAVDVQLKVVNQRELLAGPGGLSIGHGSADVMEVGPL
jgi:glycosyltransferase involved in cell wall biosynthesis